MKATEHPAENQVPHQPAHQSIYMLDRYKRGQLMMDGQFGEKGAKNDMVIAHWIGESDCFFYLKQTQVGTEFRLVDIKAKTNELAFDHVALASALSAAIDKNLDPENLGVLTDVTMQVNPRIVAFKINDMHWVYTEASKCCEKVEPPQEFLIRESYDPSFGRTMRYTQPGLISPDGKKALFTREHNLWVCDLATGKDEALTTGGTEDNAYGAVLMPVFDPLVQAVWSPDSQRILTLQYNTSGFEARPTIHYVPDDGSLKPQSMPVPFSFPGDKQVMRNRLLVIDVKNRIQVNIDYPEIPFSVFGFAFLGSVSRQYGWWSADSKRVCFVAPSRGMRKVEVVEADPANGKTRVLFEETSDTFVRLAPGLDTNPVFLPLTERDEFLWYSERSGFGHLYLYDLNTGSLKRQITNGDWMVSDIIDYCPQRREVILQTMGRDPAISPYYKDLIKLHLDTGEITELAVGNLDHYLHQQYDMASVRCATMVGGMGYRGFNGSSPNGSYFVLTRSRIDTVPESVVIDREGNEFLFQTCDISGLVDDWRWPIPVKVKSDDGKTDIYGAVFLPPDYDESKQYPVIDYSGSYRCVMHTPVGAFGNSHCIHYLYYIAPMAWASLGFVVVTLEGRGTAGRHRDFSDYGYGEPAAANDLNDRIAGIKQLAQTYKGMDLNRVGIYGPEGDTNVIFSLIDHHDFYKVAVICFFADPRLGDPLLSETYNGVPIPGEPPREARYAEDCVASLKGKLLLVEGLQNPGAASTFRLTHALEKANKSFDMFTSTKSIQDPSGYIIKRCWDYFVEHLMGEEPPKDFRLRAAIDSFHEKAEAESQ